MEKRRIDKEDGGGMEYTFDEQEHEDILIRKLREDGEHIPSRQEVDIEFIHGNGEGWLIVQPKRK